MTTRKTTPTPEQEEVETSLELSSVLEGIGGEDVVAKLYEVDEYGRNKFIEKIPLDLLRSSDVETAIQRKHQAGGTFHIRIVKAGKFLKGGSRTIHIAPDPNFETPAGYSENGNGGSGDRILTIQMEMMKMSQQSSDKTMQLMMGLLTAVIGSNRGVDPIALATLMKDSGGGGGAGQLAMVKELLGIAKELQPGGASEPDPLVGLLGQLAPALLSRGNGATPAAAVPAAPNPQAQLPPGPMKTEPAKENPEMLERLVFLTKLKSKAKAGAEIEFWADYIEQNQDEAPCQWILEVVRQHDWETLSAGLIQADPQIGTEPYLGWFQQLYDALTAPAGDEHDEAGKTDSTK